MYKEHNIKIKLHVANVTVPEKKFPHAFSAPSHLVEAHLRKFLTTSRSTGHPNVGMDELKHSLDQFYHKYKIS